MKCKNVHVNFSLQVKFLRKKPCIFKKECFIIVRKGSLYINWIVTVQSGNTISGQKRRTFS
jgi:hypothetical protein